jgi:hypothetical protein
MYFHVTQHVGSFVANYFNGFLGCCAGRFDTLMVYRRSAGSEKWRYKQWTFLSREQQREGVGGIRATYLTKAMLGWTLP